MTPVSFSSINTVQTLDYGPTLTLGSIFASFDNCHDIFSKTFCNHIFSRYHLCVHIPDVSAQFLQCPCRFPIQYVQKHQQHGHLMFAQRHQTQTHVFVTRCQPGTFFNNRKSSFFLFRCDTFQTIFFDGFSKLILRCPCFCHLSNDRRFDLKKKIEKKIKEEKINITNENKVGLH